MDDQDVLIQRFLDQDLTPDERVQFLEQVDADPGLRREWLNLEMVVAEAGRLPRITPSKQFTARVLATLDAEPRGVLDRLVAWVTAPRTLQWNLGGAMVAASVVTLAVAGLLQTIPERIVEVPTSSPSAQPVSFEQAQEPTTYVRLVLVQPGAKSVSVAGDFNGWNPNRTSMERSDGGVWTTTIRLKPGRYQYMFVIDGKQWMADPFATEDAGDGFGSQNAVLDVSTTL
ncbi:MAG: isoamylase early set domain-containing protein [Nitrospira defluvii]|nr:isoamylase early set domain-containing protein [Nitrospira defluvii]